MDDVKQSAFEGWAVLEIFGHQTYAGFVTTQTFGQAVLFRVDVPPLAERERLSKRRLCWEQLRARGDCQTAGCRNKPELNPRTQTPYWKCRRCRIALCAARKVS
jgi:hypothetical protein